MKHKELLRAIKEWTDSMAASRFPKLPTKDQPEDVQRAMIKDVVAGLSDFSIAAAIADNTLDECSGGIHMQTLIDLDSKMAQRGATYVIEQSKCRLMKAATFMLAECSTYALMMFERVGNNIDALTKAQDEMAGDLSQHSSGVFAMAHYLLKNAKDAEHIAKRANLAMELCNSLADQGQRFAISVSETPATGTSADVNVYFNCVFMMAGSVANTSKRVSALVSGLHKAFAAVGGEEQQQAPQQNILH